MNVTLTTVINCTTFNNNVINCTSFSIFLFGFCLYFILKSGNLFLNLAFMYHMAT